MYMHNIIHEWGKACVRVRAPTGRSASAGFISYAGMANGWEKPVSRLVCSPGKLIDTIMDSHARVP